MQDVTTEKKERLISNEVMSNMGDVEAQRFTRLNARKYACDQINKLFGLDVNCEFRSGIYIKADGYGAQNIASQGMQPGDVPVPAGGYQDETSGIISKLKQILGM